MFGAKGLIITEKIGANYTVRAGFSNRIPTFLCALIFYTNVRVQLKAADQFEVTEKACHTCHTLNIGCTCFE